MSTAPALHLLLQQEQSRRDQAAMRVHQAEQAARRARAQAELLLGHRAQYEARWAAQFQHRSTMDIVGCYRSFMQRLDQALAQQARQTQDAQARLDQARQVLVEAERQVASVRKLIERRMAEHSRSSARREQRHADDLALRMRQAAAPWHDPTPS